MSLKACGRSISPVRSRARSRQVAPIVGGPSMARTLPFDRTQNGDIYIWPDPGVATKLKALRGPGQSYSDVILRLAATA
jgi:hypothetical protein